MVEQPSAGSQNKYCLQVQAQHCLPPTQHCLGKTRLHTHVWPALEGKDRRLGEKESLIGTQKSRWSSSKSDVNHKLSRDFKEIRNCRASTDFDDKKKTNKQATLHSL